MEHAPFAIPVLYSTDTPERILIQIYGQEIFFFLIKYRVSFFFSPFLRITDVTLFNQIINADVLQISSVEGEKKKNEKERKALILRPDTFHLRSHRGIMIPDDVKCNIHQLTIRQLIDNIPPPPFPHTHTHARALLKH